MPAVVQTMTTSGIQEPLLSLLTSSMPGTNASAITATLTGVEAGDYTVVVTDTDGTGDGCSNTATTTVTENTP